MTASEFRPVAGRMKTYAGEDRARHACPPDTLDGSLAAAQAYVDRVTRSAWWQRTCVPHSHLGSTSRVTVRPPYARNVTPPSRIIVEQHRGASGIAHTASRVEHRGKWYPRIRLGVQDSRDGWVSGWIGASKDPYVILHEVAHIMAACDEECGERGHGRWFRYYLVLLVARWMGPEHARALKAGYEAEGLKWRKPSRVEAG